MDKGLISCCHTTFTRISIRLAFIKRATSVKRHKEAGRLYHSSTLRADYDVPSVAKRMTTVAGPSSMPMDVPVQHQFNPYSVSMLA